jgi:DNA-binding transcriptional LysR family regulator
LRRSECAKTIAQRAARGELGSLSIGFLPSATAPILPELIDFYRRQFPHVAIQLHEMSAAEQLKAMDDKRIHIKLSRPLPQKRAKEF